MFKYRNIILVLGCLLVVGFVSRSEASMIKRKTEKQRPKIWMESNIKDVMRAERIARADAMRKMAEKLYGVNISAEQNVYDLVNENSEVRAKMNQVLAGMREKAWHYYPEGICQVELEVTWRTFIKKVKEIVEAGCDACGSYFEKSVDVSVTANDKKVVVWGSGAIKGTRGVQEIQALRAAEVDAYKKMAERILGVRISSDTTVRDMVMESDRIRNTVRGIIRGAYLYDYTFEPRKVLVKCMVKRKKVLTAIKEVVSAERDEYGWVRVDIDQDIKSETKIKKFVETGIGIIGEVDKTEESVSSEFNFTFEEESGVIVE